MAFTMRQDDHTEPLDMPWLQSDPRFLSPCPSSQGVDLELDDDGCVFVFDNKTKTLYNIVQDNDQSASVASSVKMKKISKVRKKKWRMRCLKEEEDTNPLFDLSETEILMKPTTKVSKKSQRLWNFPSRYGKRDRSMDSSNTDHTVDTLAMSETTYAKSRSCRGNDLSVSDTSHKSKVGHRTSLYQIGKGKHGSSKTSNDSKNKTSRPKNLSMSDTTYNAKGGHRTTFYEIGKSQKKKKKSSKRAPKLAADTPHGSQIFELH
jgi:hypothetical protein